MVSPPVTPFPKPCLVKVAAGRTYFWCSCGRSKRQPFCDGSHQGTEFLPLKYTAPDSDELLFCGCKHTRNAPFCDGAHTNLPSGSPLDDPNSAENRGIPLVVPQADARSVLDGQCYVFSSSRARLLSRGNLRYCTMVSGEWGAQYQTQVYFEIAAGRSPILTLGTSDVILFIARGTGTLTLSGREFPVRPHDGVYVRPSEALQFTAAPGEVLQVFLLACPLADIAWLESMPTNFDAACGQRIVPVDGQQKTAMGPRYFQLLVDKAIGSRHITQFIGHIPRSKAAAHRHLYEEALIVLSGEGYMWTESRKARVAAGDVIFLPRKQLHSLEATSADGLDVVGVICPGDNPSINYYD
jgi:mannose-6-phosphate isomerase-like protein (cupin superfamily)/CDGSH-type Zn-finger protein